MYLPPPSLWGLFKGFLSYGTLSWYRMDTCMYPMHAMRQVMVGDEWSVCGCRADTV